MTTKPGPSDAAIIRALVRLIQMVREMDEAEERQKEAAALGPQTTVEPDKK